MVTTIPIVGGNFPCTVQRWVEGEHIRDAFTPQQARRIGVMIGRLHAHSNHWTPTVPYPGLEQDETWLADKLARLRPVIEMGILAAPERQIVEEAMARVEAMVAGLG